MAPCVAGTHDEKLKKPCAFSATQEILVTADDEAGRPIPPWLGWLFLAYGLVVLVGTLLLGYHLLA